MKNNPIDWKRNLEKSVLIIIMLSLPIQMAIRNFSVIIIVAICGIFLTNFAMVVIDLRHYLKYLKNYKLKVKK